MNAITVFVVAASAAVGALLLAMGSLGAAIAFWVVAAVAVTLAERGRAHAALESPVH